MHEKLVIVPRKKSTVKKILNVVWFVLACLCFLFAMWVPILFAVPAIIFAIIWSIIQAFRSDIEYQYTYYDGEFRFARIKAKRRRERDLEESRWKMFLHWHRRGTGVYTSTRMTIHLPVRI